VWEWAAMLEASSEGSRATVSAATVSTVNPAAGCKSGVSRCLGSLVACVLSRLDAIILSQLGRHRGTRAISYARSPRICHHRSTGHDHTDTHLT
jgi:hypothetical protein